MTPFTTHTGIAVLLNRDNIDTDQIIPKEHLKSILRTGFGSALFSGWRHLNDGTSNPNFELNQTETRNASILLTGNNFGCGSSREHAVWAILQAGFKAVIAPRKSSSNGILPGFADIFASNAVKNGLLTIELCEDMMTGLICAFQNASEKKMDIDLPNQKLKLGAKEWFFEIPSQKKNILIKGLDDIGRTLELETEIKAFERVHHSPKANV